jgi:hypothetical protein
VTPGHPEVDLSFRPKSYFGPASLEQHLKNSIHGEERRRIVAQLIDEGRLDELPAALGQKQLSEAERNALGWIHPAFMGGEYLPPDDELEVEVARITLRSTLSDVTCVRARSEGGRIHYRVVDEYGGDTLSGETKRVSKRPLALGELLDFFMGAWDLFAVCDMNYEGDADAALGFFKGSSPFYPAFGAALAAYVVERYRQAYGEAEEERA